MKYALCVKLDSNNDDTGYTWERTEIGDGFIMMGSFISPNNTTVPSECTLAYILIPKTYLSGDRYLVNCNLEY